MKLGKIAFNIILVILILGLAAMGAALARDAVRGAGALWTVAVKGNATPHAKGDKTKADKVKGDKVGAKSSQGAKTAEHSKPQAPIVMGRSVTVHHKTKVHHIKMKPLDTAESQEPKDKLR